MECNGVELPGTSWIFTTLQFRKVVNYLPQLFFYIRPEMYKPNTGSSLLASYWGGWDEECSIGGNLTTTLPDATKSYTLEAVLGWKFALSA